MGDLVDRELLAAERLVARGDLGEARHEQRPHRGVLGRERVREQHRRAARIVLRQSQPIAQVGGHEAHRLHLGGTRAEQRLVQAAPKELARAEAACTCSGRQRRRDVLEAVHACDLLDDVDLAGDIERSPARGPHVQLVAASLHLEAKAPEDRRRLPCFDVDAGHREHATRPQHDPLGVRNLAANVDRLRGLHGTGELDQHPRRRAIGDRRELGIDALLEAVRRLRADAEPARRAQDRSAVEGRGLEHDLGGLVRDLGVGPAHDPGEPGRTLAMRDHERLAVERALLAVEGGQLLAVARPARNQRPPGKAREVVRVQRLPEIVRDVVGDVDDVRDRADADASQAGLQPERRGRDPHARERSRGEAGTERGIVDRDVHELARRAVADCVGLALVERTQTQVEDGGDVAGDTSHRQQVGSVRQDLEVEHDVTQRDARGERLTRRVALAEDQDAPVLVGDLELALGEDHAVGEQTSELGALERAPVRHSQPRGRDGDGVARAEVPGAAHDLTGLGAAGVHATELQAVRVRVRFRLEHEAGHDEILEPRLLGQAAARDLLDLDARKRDPGAELGERR